MDSSSCQKCANLLKQVLSKVNSRPMTILESMGGTLGENEDVRSRNDQNKPYNNNNNNNNCVYVQVPKTRHGRPQKQWTQIQPPQQQQQTDTHGSSSSSSAAAAATTGRKSLRRTLQPTTMTMATSATEDDSLLSKQQSSSSLFATSSAHVSAPIVYEPLRIECRPCLDTGPERGARAFVMGPAPLSIVLCSNRLSLYNTDEMEQVLVHELMHVYDVRVHALDLRHCENLAYSEVRAAREAECASNSSSSSSRPMSPMRWFRTPSPASYCIPSKAYSATANLFPPAQARECLNKVFAAAMRDTAPFHNHNHNHYDKERTTGHDYNNNNNRANDTTTTTVKHQKEEEEKRTNVKKPMSFPYDDNSNFDG